MQRVTVVPRAGVRAFAAAAGKDSLSIVRTWGGVGRWLRDRPSPVAANQAHFAHKTAETYMAKDTDKFVMGGVIGTALIGSLLVGRGELRRKEAGGTEGGGASSPRRHSRRRPPRARVAGLTDMILVKNKKPVA
jgi:hypothetical protein